VVAGRRHHLSEAFGRLKFTMSVNPNKLLRERVPEAPIVLLAKQPKGRDRSLTIQNYHVNGELVIPLFSSEAALEESTQGVDLGCPPVAIDRALLASIIQGDEVFLLDPQLPSQLRFTALEFRQAFQGEVEAFRGSALKGRASPGKRPQGRAEPEAPARRGGKRPRGSSSPRRRGK
jgi:hypothetical protein